MKKFLILFLLLFSLDVDAALIKRSQIGPIDADTIDYDNGSSGLTATEVQGAIDDIADNALLWSRDALNAETYLTNGFDNLGIGTSNPVVTIHALFGNSLVVPFYSGTMLALESDSLSPYIQIAGANGGGFAIGDGNDSEYFLHSHDVGSGIYEFSINSNIMEHFTTNALTFNQGTDDVDVIINGDGEVNLFKTDGALNAVFIGTDTQLQGQRFQINTGNLNYGMRQDTIDTTDDTVTTIRTIPVPTNKVIGVSYHILCRRTGGSSGTTGDSAKFDMTFRANNISGTVTIHDPHADYTSADQNEWSVGWDAYPEVDGTDIDINFKGAADNNVTCGSRIEYEEL